MLSRRALLAFIPASAILAACGRGSGSSRGTPPAAGGGAPELPTLTPTPLPTATALPTATPSPTPTPVPKPEVSVSKLQAYQGGALQVTATGATSGTATVLGRSYALATGPGGVAGIVGFGVVDRPGVTPLAVKVAGIGGEAFDFRYDVTVLATNWTYDDITVAPPSNIPPTPGPALVDEQPRINALYTGVGARRWRPGWKIPVALGGEVFISSYFGEERSFNGGPRGGHHGGTDIGAPEGTPIHATNDGVVVMAERVLNRGNCTVVDHGGGVFSCYGHQQEFRVKLGDVVQQGDVIGLVGSTGLATGPHLHWEMAAGGVIVDGLRWLDGTQGF